MKNKKTRKLVIIGDSSFAEIAFEYFTYDSEYTVVDFSVEKEYLKKETLFGLPVIGFEEIENHYLPADHDVFVAITYTQLNRLRTRLADSIEKKGYTLASYISSSAFVWKNVSLGKHCFIFEDNTIQPFVTIGNNVILWSGNHIGHHSTINDNCFISSHVVISGHCIIGKNCFLGVNSTLANNVSLGEDNWLSPSAVIMKDTESNQLFNTDQNTPSRIPPRRLFKIKE